MGNTYNNQFDQYPEFEVAIKDTFKAALAASQKLFTTDAQGLFDAYLNNLPQEAQQHYRCNACRHFIERFGNLVSISEDGNITPVMWDPSKAPKFFRKSAEAMYKIVSKARVTGIFLSDTMNLGIAVTGEWTHLHAQLPREMIFRSRLLTPGQAMAEKTEEYRMLTKGLVEFPMNIVEQSLNLLRSEALYRSDKCLGVAEWLKKVHEKRDAATNSKARENITWLAVATAPTGFCHVRSSMIGTLLDDIASGLSFESVKRRFAEKMDPSNYMRSQVAPTQGNIEQAEKIVAKLGLETALQRKYATIGEIPTDKMIWTPNGKVEMKAAKTTGGVFGNVTPRGKAATPTTNTEIVPSSVMTWDKFLRTVVPTADTMEVRVDNPGRLMALVTAADPSAENIMQWDNPFSWYYHGGIDGEMKRRVEEAGGRYENNEIRCSLMWEGLTDLDLHCVTPRREHIYFSSKHDRFGGWLDLDMNGIDKSSEHPVENMRWERNAPEGHYEFYVHNYNERVNGFRGTAFKVELEINGQVYSYVGEPLKNKGQVTVFEFNYVRGQQPVISAKTSSVATDDWGINTNEFVKVTGITNSPNLWPEQPVIHSGSHIFFLLDGCKDHSEGRGRGFFTEMLRSDLREVRKTLEAYAAGTPIEDADNASACGVGFSKDAEWNVTIKVTSGGSSRIVKIDRWD